MLNAQSHAKFAFYHVDGDGENPNVKLFDNSKHLIDQNHVNYVPEIHTRVKQIILCVTFLIICGNHSTLQLQRTRIQDMQFAVYISDTPVTLKQSQDHQN